jgi:hypothetical protein
MLVATRGFVLTEKLEPFHTIPRSTKRHELGATAEKNG